MWLKIIRTVLKGNSEFCFSETLTVYRRVHCGGGETKLIVLCKWEETALLIATQTLKPIFGSIMISITPLGYFLMENSEMYNFQSQNHNRRVFNFSNIMYTFNTTLYYIKPFLTCIFVSLFIIFKFQVGALQVNLGSNKHIKNYNSNWKMFLIFTFFCILSSLTLIPNFNFPLLF